MRRRLLPAVVAAVAVALSGCAAVGEDGATTGAGDAAGLSGALRVSAAASLGAAFDEIAVAFERENPDVEVRPITYDGSATLATQIVEGAAADVFASADESNMQRVVDAGLATDPAVFATNTLVIVVPADDPAGVERLADLADDDVTVVLCAPEVPCGAASATLLERAEVAVDPASLEQNVTAVLTKVAAGEADAGLVYATDARASADVRTIVPAGAADVVNRYPIAVLDAAADADLARAFVAFVHGEQGQRILTELGFGTP